MTLRSKDRDQDRSAAKPIAAQKTIPTAINNVRFVSMPHSLKMLPNDNVYRSCMVLIKNYSLIRAPAEWVFGRCLLFNGPLKVFQGCNRLSIQIKHRLAELQLCGLSIEYFGQHLERHPNIVVFCHAATRVYGVKLWHG